MSGFSRDDVEAKFILRYLRPHPAVQPVLRRSMPARGRVVDMGCTKGRATNPDIQLGVCGEHGGDPDSVKTFHKIGLTYVSCLPYRVPLASPPARRRWPRRWATTATSKPPVRILRLPEGPQQRALRVFRGGVGEKGNAGFEGDRAAFAQEGKHPRCLVYTP